MDGGRFNCFCDARSELEDGHHLFSCHAELFHEFGDAHILQILEHDGYRRARAPENPSAAAPSEGTFDCWAL